MIKKKVKVIQHITNFCAYCGSDESKRERTTFGTPITQEAVKKVMRAKDSGVVYFLKLCPACNTIIEVIEE